MEREKTGAELLLSEPEILAWLGQDDRRSEVPAPTGRADSDARQTVSPPRALRFGMAV
jgi:hypothetical protein